jgi:preprotein translocase subunit YajC
MQQFFIPLLIVLVAIPLFLQARKQKKTMQEQQKLQNAVGVGDRIMTTSGLYGTVVGTSDDTLDLEIADGVTTTWLRQAVRERVETDSDDESDSEELAETDSDEAGSVEAGSAEAGSTEAGSTEAGSAEAESTGAGSAEKAESGASESGVSGSAEKAETQKTS